LLLTSTLEAKNIHVGAINQGSIHRSEFLQVKDILSQYVLCRQTTKNIYDQVSPFIQLTHGLVYCIQYCILTGLSIGFKKIKLYCACFIYLKQQ